MAHNMHCDLWFTDISGLWDSRVFPIQISSTSDYEKSESYRSNSLNQLQINDLYILCAPCFGFFRDTLFQFLQMLN